MAANNSRPDLQLDPGRHLIRKPAPAQNWCDNSGNSWSQPDTGEGCPFVDLEGLVEIAPNRGAKVIGISRNDVADTYHMRARLEGLAAKKAAEHIKEEELAEMEEVILLSEFHVKKPESKQMVRLDGRFHEIMYRASGSRMLEHVLTDFLHYVKMARSHSVKTEHRAQESVKEHKRILEAIRQRDGDLAEQLANEHIQHVIENLDLH